MMETPHIRPWNETPSYSFPTGVRTVLGTTGRWFKPEIMSHSARQDERYVDSRETVIKWVWRVYAGGICDGRLLKIREGKTECCNWERKDQLYFSF